MSFCVSVVTINPTDDPRIDDMPLFDRPPLTEEEQVVWAQPPGRKPFPMYAPGRRRQIGPLLIEESLHAEGHACYLPGLHLYHPGDWEGKGYFLFADSGRRYPPTAWIREQAGKPIYDSEPLVIPRWDLPRAIRATEAEHIWALLVVPPPYREPADIFLRAALAVSRDRRVLFVCEYNGDVSGYHGDGILDGSERIYPNPETQRLGPLTPDEFWRRTDAREVIVPSLTLIEE